MNNYKDMKMEKNDFICKIEKDELTITRYTRIRKSVVIPEKIDGFPVRVIGMDASFLRVLLSPPVLKR